MTATFVRVCRADEIEEGRTRVVNAGGKELFLAGYKGEIYAVENICSHDGGNLGDGSLIEDEVECPRHGARFNIITGQPTRMPAVMEIQSFEIKVENGDVLVESDG